MSNRDYNCCPASSKVVPASCKVIPVSYISIPAGYNSIASSCKASASVYNLIASSCKEVASNYISIASGCMALLLAVEGLMIGICCGCVFATNHDWSGGDMASCAMQSPHLGHPRFRYTQTRTGEVESTSLLQASVAVAQLTIWLYAIK